MKGTIRFGLVMSLLRRYAPRNDSLINQMQTELMGGCVAFQALLC
ncbi:hypothetical protein ES703_59241 [subsurface metagenome]